MKKIGLIFDSSCGYSKEKIEKDGNHFVPLKVNIDGKEFLSGIDLNNELLFKKFKEIKEPFKTSALNIGEFEIELKKALEKSEKIIYISISTHLSSTNLNIKHFIENSEIYKDRVVVFKSYFLTPWIQFIYNELLEMTNYDKAKIEEIIEFLEFYNSRQRGYISLHSLERLRIGGRLNEAQYKISKLLKIFPIIEVINGDLNAGKIYKVRNKEKIVPKIVSIVEKEYKKLEDENPKGVLKILYLNHGNEEMKEEMYKISKENGFYIENDVILSPEINAHLGENCFGMGIIQYRNWKTFLQKK